jgi:hypothetical protein
MNAPSESVSWSNIDRSWRYRILSWLSCYLNTTPEEHDVAIEHLDSAIAEFRDMKMQPALERALGRRGLLKA